MTTTTSPLSFPAEFENVVNLTSRGFATSIVATQLMLLDAVALAAGNLFRIRIPDFHDHIPALNLGVISSGESLPHGAMMALTKPVVDIVGSATLFRNMRGPNLTHASFEDLIRQRECVEADVKRETRELEELGDASVQTPEEQKIFVDDVMGLNADKPPGILLRRKQLREELDSSQIELETVKQRIAALRFESGVHVLLKDTPWRDIPGKCTQSFDGNCAVFVFAPEILKALCSVRRADLDLCAAALHRTLTGSTAPGNGMADSLPGTWAILCGELELWSQIFLRDAVTESGLLNDFLVVEAGSEGGQCDPAAMVELGKMTFWRDFMEKLFERRQYESPRLLLLNVAGARQFLDFRRWCRTFSAGLSADIRPYFARYPEVAVRIALGLGIIHDDVKGDTLPECHLMAACEFAKRYAPIQAALLEKMISTDSKAATAEREMQRMIGKLRRRGPLSKRGLVRTYDKQDYGRIEELLEIGIERKLVDQRGPLFFVPAVSDSADGERVVLNFPEPVSP